MGFKSYRITFSVRCNLSEELKFESLITTGEIKTDTIFMFSLKICRLRLKKNLFLKCPRKYQFKEVRSGNLRGHSNNSLPPIHLIGNNAYRTHFNFFQNDGIHYLVDTQILSRSVTRSFCSRFPTILKSLSGRQSDFLFLCQNVLKNCFQDN